MYKKGMVLAIICLFIGAGVVPLVGSTIVEVYNLDLDNFRENLSMKIIFVPDDYPTIKQAISHAYNGDTIKVRAGTYVENIVVDKMLDVIGEDRYTTIIDGGGKDTVVTITADGVTFTDFTIQNSGSHDAGMYVTSHYNIINRNLITDNYFGLKLDASSGNQIHDNSMVNNNVKGLWLYRSHANNITGNKMTGNGNHLTMKAAQIENADGVTMNFSCIGNSFTGNEISDNGLNGVSISETSRSNSFFENNIVGNSNKGVNVVGMSDSNIFSSNAFVENGQNSFDTSINKWYQGSVGNYWSDYTGLDADGDGIGDTPYQIPGGENEDPYPLMTSPPVPPATPDAPSCLDCPGPGELLNPGEAYTFHFQTSHPICDWVWYHIDWDGDLVVDEKVVCNDPENGIDVSHAFPDLGGCELKTYNIRVYAENEYGLTSDWSPPLSATPRFRDQVTKTQRLFPFIDFLKKSLMDVNTDLREIQSLSTDMQGPVTNVNTSETFDNIQDAIDDNDTLDGHWITVEPKKYDENIVIYKSVKLIGDNHEGTIIDGCGQDVIKINVSNVSISGFTITNSSGSSAGITVSSSDNIIIMDNIISNNYYGILLESSDSNTIGDNSILNNYYGIRLEKCSSNNIFDNAFENNNIFINGINKQHYLHDITGNTLNGNLLCYYKNEHGIEVSPDCKSVIIVDCHDVTIHDVEISDTNIGIMICYSSDFLIENPSIISNNDIGIYLKNSSEGIIKSVDISSNLVGLAIENCSNIVVQGNDISENYIGILLEDVSNCKIHDGNMIGNNEYGVRLINCLNLAINNNTFNGCSLRIDGDLLKHFIHDIGDDNIVNDGILFYRKNISGVSVPKDASCAIIVNCEDISILNMNLSDVDICVELAYSRNAVIYNSMMSNSDIGIYLCHHTSAPDFFDIYNNVIEENGDAGILIKDSFSFEIGEGNQIKNNEEGIRIINSTGCTISGNTLQENTYAGFFIENSFNNTISGNNISYNHQGIDIDNSNDNEISGNAIWENDNGGISMYLCNDNTIIDNDIIGFGWNGILESNEDKPVNDKGNRGIWMDRSSDNDIISNMICSCWGNGLQLSGSSDNLIKCNTFCLNRLYGVRIEKNSNGNTIYNNYFDQNYWFMSGEWKQAYDSCDNTWNLSYYGPEYERWGNCWKFHQSPDDFQGENQDEIGSDGVVDLGRPNGGLNTYLGIDGGDNEDCYPLVEPGPCTPPCGRFGVNHPPNINITEPDSGKLYYLGKQIFSFPFLLCDSICLGDMWVEVDVDDPDTWDSVCVEFYLYFSPGEDLRHIDCTHPYRWRAWGERLTGGPSYRLLVKATDSRGASSQDEMDLRIFCI